MSTTFGISLGADVVCGAILTRDRSRGDVVDVRMVAVDSRREVGDLVIACADLLAGLVDGQPEQIAVTYRSRSQAMSVRAVSDRRITLVPEATAAIACLGASGELAGHRRVALVDVGDTGTATSVVDAAGVDSAEPILLAYDHTTEMSGAVFDDLLDGLIRSRRTIDPDVDRDLLGARVRTAKEQLSFADSTLVHRIGEQPLSITRADFETAIAPALLAGIASVDAAVAQSPALPDAFVLIGGGAHIPILARILGESFGLPVVVPHEPDTVLARGAALLAQPGDEATGFAVVSPVERIGPRLSLRGAGVLAGAIAIATLALTYGPRETTGITPDAASAVSTRVWSTTAVESTLTASSEVPVGSTVAQPAADSSDRSTTPRTTRSLHPGPDLPAIPLPSAQPVAEHVEVIAAPDEQPAVIPAPETTVETTTTPVVTVPSVPALIPPSAADRTRPDRDRTRTTTTEEPPTTTTPPTTEVPPTTTSPRGGLVTPTLQGVVPTGNAVPRPGSATTAETETTAQGETSRAADIAAATAAEPATTG